MTMTDPILTTFSAAIPDPSLGEFLELRLSLVKIALSDDASRYEEARHALRELGAKSSRTIRRTGLGRRDDLFGYVCFAARSHVAEARHILTSATNLADLVRARRRLYRGLCVMAEALTATSTSRSSGLRGDSPLPRGNGVLFAAFVTQIRAATRANPKDVLWVLQVADAEISVAAAHPLFARLSADQRTTLRALRAEIAEFASGERNSEVGFALLNRLVLLVDGLNH
jgi:hypothetical protein